jgi:hypothetical protein
MPSVDAINWIIAGVTVTFLWAYSKVVNSNRN